MRAQKVISRTARAGRAPFSLRTWFAVAGGMVIAAAYAAVVHGAQPVGPDVGWLAVLAGRVLDGARLYVDVAEMNPPMSVYLYGPVVIAERLTGLSLSAAVVVAMIVLASLALRLSASLTRGVALPLPPAAMVALFGFVTLVLPGSAFAQREHVALVLMIPLLAAFVARIDGTSPRPAALWAAGVAAGLAVAIKPHFAAAVALPAIAVAVRTRSPRPLVAPEVIAAALVAALYALHVRIAYPVYLETWLPILADTYRANRASVLERVTDLGTLASLALCAPVFLGAVRRTLPAAALIAALAALGFWLAVFEQGKLWNNHFLPVFALALSAAALALTALPERLRMLSALAVAPAAASALLVLASGPVDTTRLADAIRREAPARPRIFAITPAVAAGHPLTGLVDGQWMGSMHGQWLWQFADWRLRTEPRLDPALAARLERYKTEDRARLRSDLLASNADVILVDRSGTDWLAWAEEDPVVKAVLSGYAKTDVDAGVELWVRRSGTVVP